MTSWGSILINGVLQILLVLGCNVNASRDWKGVWSVKTSASELIGMLLYQLM